MLHLEGKNKCKILWNNKFIIPKQRRAPFRKIIARNVYKETIKN